MCGFRLRANLQGLRMNWYAWYAVGDYTFAIYSQIPRCQLFETTDNFVFTNYNVGWKGF